jgi:hypothetical protein
MKFISLVSLVSLISFHTYAGRGGRQHQRIQQGVASGQLTHQEAQKLRQEQRDIRDEKKEAMSDGVLTKEEKQNLNQERNQASRHIRRQKHDDQKRGQNGGGIVEDNDLNIPVGSTTPEN